MPAQTKLLIIVIIVLFALVFLLSPYSGHIYLTSASKDSNRIPGSTDFILNGPTSLNGLLKEKRQSVFFMQQFEPQRIVQNKDPNLDYKSEMKALIKQNVSADNPRFVQLIRNYYIEQPSTEPYNLDVPNRLEYSAGQTPFIDSRLNYIEGGFYVECGGLTGEKGSTSFFFEKVRRWNGILIEADPTNYKVLKTKHRKAFTINACLSPRSTPAILTFNKAFNRGRIMHDQKAKDWVQRLHIKSDPVEVECFPFYSFMLALNKTTIDFFSLDVEGDELNVLKTIPFHKLNIKMLTVEYLHHEKSGNNKLQSFMESKGYDTILKMQRDDGGVDDILFRKKGLTH